jgi:hypothetical protein
LQLAGPHGHDGLRVVALLPGLHAAGTVAAPTVGAGDEHRPDALGRSLGQHSPGARGLVVGMRMDGHEGERA